MAAFASASSKKLNAARVISLMDAFSRRVCWSGLPYFEFIHVSLEMYPSIPPSLR